MYIHTVGAMILIYKNGARQRSAACYTRENDEKEKKGKKEMLRGTTVIATLLANYTERRISDERSEQSQRCYGNMLNFIYKSHIILFFFCFSFCTSYNFVVQQNAPVE